MIKSWEWFIKHGYTDPKEMIDHNENLDLPEAFMQIFVAYNQHNIAEGKAWDTWPKWELSSTSIKQDFHCAYDQEFDSEVTKTVRQHWFAAMEFMHAHQEISFDGYTIIIKGQHGNTFSFDFALGNETWGKPGTYAAQKVILDTNAKNRRHGCGLHNSTRFPITSVIRLARIGSAQSISQNTVERLLGTRQKAPSS